MIDALLFDLDGTLTAPGLIDFQVMREAIGCPAHANILAFLQQLAASDRLAYQRAAAEVDRLEREALTRVVPAPGLYSLLDWLQTRPLKLGIFTRNSRPSALYTLDALGIRDRFSPIITREDAPPKPAPDSVHLAALCWELPPERLLVIGDYRYDIEAGAAAGALTLLCTDDHPDPLPVQPNFSTNGLNGIPSVVERLILG